MLEPVDKELTSIRGRESCLSFIETRQELPGEDSRLRAPAKRFLGLAGVDHESGRSMGMMVASWNKNLHADSREPRSDLAP